MSAQNEQPREGWMSTETLVQYMINAAVTGLATGAFAAIVALFVAGK